MRTIRYAFAFCCLASSARAAQFEEPEFGQLELFRIHRCSLEDQLLTNEEALQRIDWAISCGVIAKKFKVKMTMDFDDEGLPTARAQYFYPTFALREANYPMWRPNYASCDRPGNLMWLGACIAGCYQADQALQFSTGPVEIGEAWAHDRTDIITLDPGSTRTALLFKPGQVEYYTQDWQPQWQPIVDLRVEGGFSLRLTPTHPLVVATGQMRQVAELKVGDRLLRFDGTERRIEKMSQRDVYTKVYNLAPKSKAPSENVLLVQGFLTGSTRYQNEYQKYLNRLIVRADIPDSAL